ncbi:uncharacterized protein TrAtP1_005511 [Trichoderma atroviride]|uniref:uncharacterized protein n=1 Tax=Hypocrea atroviridis TaxID=63577 RepID=UPI003333E747|nr:hypothetical protein TrAtP1_005511 [Trichoderma atroviride]
MMRANEATDSATQAAARPCVPAPNDPKYSLSHFQDESKETGPSCQRPPPGFGKMQGDAEAVAEAEARMRKELRAFDAKFLGGTSAGK